jgi:hypothetical protein
LWNGLTVEIKINANELKGFPSVNNLLLVEKRRVLEKKLRHKLPKDKK